MDNAQKRERESSSETANTERALEVREMLRQVACAVEETAQSLGTEQIDRALQLLAECSGQVILLGVGKSGFVARKLAATLTSTGTRARFVHPSDALHGDLGIVSSKDVVILLSNSGETDEVNALLPHLKRREVCLIAIVGNPDSTLAHHADVVLDASVKKETCPFNLAPTTSTTVALAVGDAMAVALMRIKGITPDDFALNHPAGRIGKRLSLKVGDLMHGDVKNPTVSPDASWLEIVSSISKGGLGAVNVVSSTGTLAGVITDGDLRRAIEGSNAGQLDGLTATSIMTATPVTVGPDELAYAALQLMENRPSQISVLPVVDDQKRCIGLLRLHDLVRSGL